MKKNLLLILVFLAFIGCNTEDMSTQNILDEIKIPELAAPKIDTKSSSNEKIEGKKGDEIKIIVKYTANPDITAVVTKEGQEGPITESYSITVKDKQVTVILRNVKLGDSGKYTVKITNSLGEASISFTVQITE